VDTAVSSRSPPGGRPSRCSQWTVTAAGEGSESSSSTDGTSTTTSARTPDGSDDSNEPIAGNAVSSPTKTYRDADGSSLRYTVDGP
jgi:hypothetical protein